MVFQDEIKNNDLKGELQEESSEEDEEEKLKLEEEIRTDIEGNFR